MEGDHLHQVYALLALVPFLMLFLSAGIAWGVTTATVKALKNAVQDAAEDAAGVASDLNLWKIQRTNAVVTFPDCTEIRNKCSSEHSVKVDNLTQKFERYTEKTDKRWEELIKLVAGGNNAN